MYTLLKEDPDRFKGMFTMKNLLFCCLSAMLIGIVPNVVATPVPCPTTGTVATLIVLSGIGDGCLINGLVFNNFTFTPSATGTGVVPTAAQVAYTLDNPGTSTGTGQLIYGFEFNPNLSVVGIGSEDTLLNYTIIAPSAIIASTHLLENSVTLGGTAATVAEGPDRGCTGVGTGCVFLPTLTVSSGAPHQDLLGIGPFTELDVFKDINVTSTSASGVAAISQVRDSVDLTTNTTIPEPTTYLMIGSALVGLATIRWRKL